MIQMQKDHVLDYIPEFKTDPKQSFDIVIVSGDAYVDHPSFGPALIGRLLQSLGYEVGIIAQPDWTSADDFRRLGKPRLFFGVTAGNMDSMVAHFTPNRRRRRHDAFSPGGRPGLRPDYATVVYSQRCREAFNDVPIVLGGIEASLRRLAHYDYVQQRVRASILIDAKADYLIYGMAERAIAELAALIEEGASREDMERIRGLAFRTTSARQGDGTVTLPSFEAVSSDPDAFFEFHRQLGQLMFDASPPPIVQPHGSQLVVVMPPSKPLSSKELDSLYEMPFNRDTPPRYHELGGIPALESVRFSITTHRGCYGGCSFCAITTHQGKEVASRTQASIVAEARHLSKMDSFRGTIQDVGGPTANMYDTGCTAPADRRMSCSRASCLCPEPCAHLRSSGAGFLKLLREIRRLPGVRHAFVASGLRHDLLVLPAQRRLLRELIQHHTGGRMKVAPEHIASRPLRLMNKGYARKFREFLELFRTIKTELQKDEVCLVPYLMTGHPGCDLRDSVDLALFAKQLDCLPEQVQDFTPSPMTRSTCMAYTGRDPDTGESVRVPGTAEKRLQRALAQYRAPANTPVVTGYLEKTGQLAVLAELYGKGPTPPQAKRHATRRAGRRSVQRKRTGRQR